MRQEEIQKLSNENCKSTLSKEKPKIQQGCEHSKHIQLDEEYINADLKEGLRKFDLIRQKGNIHNK